jgi:3'-5' exoribonuclease
MKQVFIQDIVRDTEVKDYFLVSKKAIYSTRNNTKYASIKLKDKTGSIEARIWDRVDELAADFDQNDIVFIESKAKLYQNQLQLNITNINKVEKSLTNEEIRQFYPESSQNSEKCLDSFYQLIGSISNESLRQLISLFHQREDLFGRFCLFPASVGVHHVSIGGLLHHSVNVAEIGSQVSSFTGGDRDIVIAGSLLHDVGKIEEIGLKGGGFGYTDRGRLLGHITLGIMLLEDLISSVENFPVPLADVLKHIILSHHGEAEWGSPKKPMCVEALIVHYIDNLDAKVMGVKEHMDSNMEDERWSQFHRLYESRFYKIPDR